MAYYFSYSAKDLSKKLKEITTPELYKKLYNKNKLHCTMLYSHEEFKEEYTSLQLPSIEVTINSIELWETNNGSVIVARLAGQNVFDMHEKIKQAFNIIPERDFNPHITLRKMVNEYEFLTKEEIGQLEILKGSSVHLNKFEVIPVMPKPKLKM